jgi:hypothetical protein
MRLNSPVQMAEHDAMKKERTDRLAATLVARLAQAWSSDTSSDPKHWSASNPAWGQCAVTALIVQDLLGGQLLRSTVGTISHYWNQLPSGDELDLTRQQFGEHTVMGPVELRTREYVLSSPETVRRYDELKRRVAGIQELVAKSR